MAYDATIPDFYDTWVFHYNSETNNSRNFDLACDKSWLAFPPDAVGILYLVVAIHAWGDYISCDGTNDCCGDCGRTNIVCGAEITL